MNNENRNMNRVRLLAVALPEEGGTMNRIRLLVSLILLAVAMISSTAIIAGCTTAKAQEGVVATYSYDPELQRWVKTEARQEGQNGSVVKNGNTIIIRIDQDNPVKEIVIDEALIIRGNEPLLDIKGHDTTGTTGKLNIGTLLFNKVDAKQLEIDADVVRTELENVVAEDNELDLDLNVVNVIRVGRGGASSLFLGKAEPRDLEENNVKKDPDLVTGQQNAVTGLRVDRIRILGPDTGTGFIERITVQNSSVFGKIEVKDVRIQDLILHNVSLDDSQ